MRVLHVIPAIAARYGGPSEAVVRMCTALEARGITTQVATTDADGDGRLAVSCGTEQVYEGVRMIFFPRFDERFKYSPGLSRWLRDSAGHFDVVHIHAVFSHASVAAARACRRANVPYVLRSLGSLDPWGMGRHKLPKRVLRWLAVDQMLRAAACVHFTTEDERRLAATAFSDLRAAVIPLGVNDELLAPPTSDDREPLVVAIGRLHPVKNLEAIIEAFRMVTATPSRASWRLIIAGDGDPDYREHLQRCAGQAFADGRIALPGWLRGDAKVRVLDRAAIFVQASHQESFGLSLLEAMARGVSVVAARAVNLATEVAASGGGWVVSGDAMSIGAALATAIDDPADRGRRAVAARALAERFAWSGVAADLVRLYQRVIDESLAGSHSVAGVEAGNPQQMPRTPPHRRPGAA
jgi:glycosyltransferase involved in cell wall biosynthesis